MQPWSTMLVKSSSAHSCWCCQGARRLLCLCKALRTAQLTTPVNSAQHFHRVLMPCPDKAGESQASSQQLHCLTTTTPAKKTIKKRHACESMPAHTHSAATSEAASLDVHDFDDRCIANPVKCHYAVTLGAVAGPLGVLNRCSQDLIRGVRVCGTS